MSVQFGLGDKYINTQSKITNVCFNAVGEELSHSMINCSLINADTVQVQRNESREWAGLLLREDPWRADPALHGLGRRWQGAGER